MNVFKLFGEIAIKGTEESKKDIHGVVGDASEAGKKLALGLGKMAVTAAKIGAAAVGAVASGIGVLTKKAVANYAEYEQLVGGVETLFKESSKKVMEYANTAYKNAGLSANQYMNTVTSFSASLLQSLEGDTERAIEAANMAINDMADNANKMGTSMESIQYAYNGFAKQNYTMLDNLKLGYGGTKAEMERLLKDAEELKKKNGEIVKYSIDSYADIIDAIHTVQVEMGIYGTTSKEAATTIQGSMGMMQAAWENFMTGMADESQDFDTLLNNLVDSVITFTNNLIPRIMETLPRIIKGLTQLVKKLAPYVPKILKELIPAMIEGATEVLQAVVSDLPSIFETMFGPVGATIGATISDFVNTMVQLVTEIAQKIGPPLLNFAQNVLPIVSDAVQFVADVFLGFLDVVMSIGKFLGDAVEAIFGINISLFDEAEALGAATQEAMAHREAVEKNIASYYDLRDAIKEKADAELQSIDHIQGVWEELQKLCDANGNVAEQDQARASFLANQLANALGIEIELTDGQIKNYQELQQSIKDTIETKKMEILLQGQEEAYAEAIKNVGRAEKDRSDITKRCTDLEAQLTEIAAQRKQLAEEEAQTAMTDATINEFKHRKEALDQEQADIEAALAQEQLARNKNKTELANYYADIETYENAAAEALQGNTDAAIETLNSRDKAYEESYKKLGENTKEFSDTVISEAERVRNEAESKYKQVGTAMGDSIISGANSKGSAINAALTGIVNAGMRAAIAAAGAKAASAGASIGTSTTARAHAKGGIVKKGEIAFLEGEGTEAVVPLEKNTEWIGKVADQFTSAVNARQSSDAVPVATPSLAEKFDSLTTKFDSLIDLLTNQRIYLDSGALVGELTPAFDTSLGEVYSRKARGI